METAPLAFFPQCKDDDEPENRDNFKSGERPTIAVTRAECELRHGSARANQRSQLVGKTRNKPTRFVGHHFGQMYRDNSPCALDTELHKERTNNQNSDRSSKSPKRN